jgi:AraC-like DNA-binding protein
LGQIKKSAQNIELHEKICTSRTIRYTPVMTVIGPSIMLARHVALRLRHVSSEDLVSTIAADIGMENPLTCRNDVTISTFEEAAFIQSACDRVGDIDLGFSAGLTYSSAGTLATYILRHANTLREGLELFCNYSHAVRPGMNFALDGYGNIATLRLTLSDPKLHPFPRHRECLYASITAQIRAFTQRAFYPDGLSFTHNRIPVSKEIRARLGCQIDFDAEDIEMLLGLPILSAPMVSHDDVLKGLLIKQGDIQIEALNHPEPSIAEKVELLIEASFPDQLLTADAAAKELALSRRTLSRRLSEAETSFHAILNHVRLRLAQRTLRDSKLPIYEIATRLGYSSQAAFATAFRRETGLTPREFRQGHHRASQTSTLSKV